MKNTSRRLLATALIGALAAVVKNAAMPTSEIVSVTGLTLVPNATAPVAPRSARVAAAMTPHIANCQDATTGVAPHFRVCLYVNAVEKTWPAGNVNAIAVLA